MVSQMARLHLNLISCVLPCYLSIGHDFSSFLLQICVMANVYPETADEVFALLPSLKVN